MAIAEPIVLPPGVALGIIAFLLSLLPAGLFMWVWYLRRHDRPVPVSTVVIAFLLGMGIVLPAFRLEQFAEQLWTALSPETSHYFRSTILPILEFQDIVLPALGTFLVVAVVEEGLRYLILRVWIRRSRSIDQIFDGLVVGITMGLGFATLENTLYFLNLFQQGLFNTLVFVFFLRFIISTIAHISFGGLMGALIARGVFEIYRARAYLWGAFILTWFLHGLYDLLLALNLTQYAVIILLPALAVLVRWAGRREFFAIMRKEGHVLVQEEAPVTKRARLMHRFFEQLDSPWNRSAPWLRERSMRQTLLRELESNG